MGGGGVGQGIRARQGQHTGGGVPAAGDGGGVGEGQHVFGAVVAGGERDRGTGEVGRVNVRDRQRGGDRGRGVVLDVTQRTGLDVGKHRCVVDRGIGDVSVADVEPFARQGAVVDLEAGGARGV